MLFIAFGSRNKTRNKTFTGCSQINGVNGEDIFPYALPMPDIVDIHMTNGVVAGPRSLPLSLNTER